MRILKNKKTVDDDWTICDDEFLPLEEETSAEPKKSTKKMKPKKKKKEKDTKTDNEYQEDEFQHVEEVFEEIDYLNSEYIYDVAAQKPMFSFWKIFGIFSVLSIFALIGIGYAYTDFDQSGNGYIVPLEIHYERRYVKESDIILDEVISIADSIYEDSSNLIDNYISLSTKLSGQAVKLRDDTTELSRYVGVPTSMETYHSTLLNFSVKTQNFLMTLLNNYTNQDYVPFKEKGVSDLIEELTTLVNFRRQIDDEIFRNID